MNDILQWLENWYQSQCDGDWEHSYGVKIETVDNPGWDITIDLEYTELCEIELEIDTIEKSETDWYYFKIKEQKFNAAGDPSKLEFLLNKFREIAEKAARGEELPRS